MANAYMFRWEDSQALKHHCGVCERPLSHPSARISCFGIHSEPCIRYHQAIFMRGRGHTCTACIIADEAHHNRHQQIAEMLPRIYELCGTSVQSMFTMAENLGRKAFCGNGKGGSGKDTRPPDSAPDANSSDLIEPSKNTNATEKLILLNKRERKDKKRLAKAALRPKFVTQLEIARIAAILHTESSEDSDDRIPSNMEELEEIENNLRYQANIYNNGVKRAVLCSFDKTKYAHVDFEAEMDRILISLKITGLELMVSRNKSIQTKDLRTFTTMVAVLKKSIVEDIVLVKKDEMEVHMRRAGYLRYTNRRSEESLEERYKYRDRRTGERILRIDDHESDDSPASITPMPSIPYAEKEDIPPANEGVADRRHHLLGHRKVTSIGKEDEAMDLVPAPLEPRGNSPQRKNFAILKIVSHGAKETLEELSKPKKGGIELIYSNGTTTPSAVSVDGTPRMSSLGLLAEIEDSFSLSSDSNISWSVSTPPRRGISPTPATSSLPQISKPPPPPVFHPAPGSSEQVLESCHAAKKPSQSGLKSIKPTESHNRYQILGTLDDQGYTASTAEMSEDSEVGEIFDIKDTYSETTKRNKSKLMPEPKRMKPPGARLRDDAANHKIVFGPPAPTLKKLKKRKRELERKARKHAAVEAQLTGLRTQLAQEDNDEDTIEGPLQLSMDAIRVEHRLDEGVNSTESDPSIYPVTTIRDEDKVSAQMTDGFTTSMKANAEDLGHGVECSLSKDSMHRLRELLAPYQASIPLSQSSPQLSIHSTGLTSIFPPPARSQANSAAELPISTTKHQSDWGNYTQAFQIEQFDRPYIPEYAPHCCYATCPFKDKGLKDCPFHVPTHGYSSIVDRVNIVYNHVHSNRSWSFGPYYNHRGTKLLKILNTHDTMRGRLLLIDYKLHGWLQSDRKRPPPIQLFNEYNDYMVGCGAGPWMKQEKQFDTIKLKNASLNTQPSRDQAMAIISVAEPADRPCMCFCQVPLPNKYLGVSGRTYVRSLIEADDSIVRCGYKGCRIHLFHRACIEDEFHPEALSRWYCAHCEYEMKLLAIDTLNEGDLCDKCGNCEHGQGDESGRMMEIDSGERSGDGGGSVHEGERIVRF